MTHYSLFAPAVLCGCGQTSPSQNSPPRVVSHSSFCPKCEPCRRPGSSILTRRHSDRRFYKWFTCLSVAFVSYSYSTSKIVLFQLSQQLCPTGRVGRTNGCKCTSFESFNNYSVGFRK